MVTILPLVSLAVGLAYPASAHDQVVRSPRAAQVRLVELLTEADEIHGVTARGTSIAFAIDRDGAALRVVATTKRGGEIVALTIAPAGPSFVTASVHETRESTTTLASKTRETTATLSWLGRELADVTAITRLRVNAKGTVTLTTTDDRAYVAIPHRGPDRNVAVESRWEAAWDSPES